MVPPDPFHPFIQQPQHAQQEATTEAAAEPVPEHIVAACNRQRSLDELMYETDASMCSRYVEMVAHRLANKRVWSAEMNKFLMECTRPKRHTDTFGVYSCEPPGTSDYAQHQE